MNFFGGMGMTKSIKQQNKSSNVVVGLVKGQKWIIPSIFFLTFP